ncbi:hypothetical protein ACFYZ2_18200 [Streptomyces sviceus]|uniref:hypothetical protein n=1 Tax=Streptomyces sviceus TaxID=285530 RepID=UPI00369FAC33
MSSPPAPSPDRHPRTVLDHRIETAAGCSIETLWRHREAGLLDAPHSALADAHRDLVRAERDVTFHRARLARLVSGEFPVDQALLARIERTVDQLAHTIDERDTEQARAAAALEPIEAAAPLQAPQQVPTKDFAALLAIAQGAKLHKNLLTHRLAVATPPAPASPTPSCSACRRAASWTATPPTQCTPASPSPSPTPAGPSLPPRAPQARPAPRRRPGQRHHALPHTRVAEQLNTPSPRRPWRRRTESTDAHPRTGFPPRRI